MSENKYNVLVIELIKEIRVLVDTPCPKHQLNKKVETWWILRNRIYELRRMKNADYDFDLS